MTQPLDHALGKAGNGWIESAGQLGALRLATDSILTGAITLAGNTRIAVNSANTQPLARSSFPARPPTRETPPSASAPWSSPPPPTGFPTKKQEPELSQRHIQHRPNRCRHHPRQLLDPRGCRNARRNIRPHVRRRRFHPNRGCLDQARRSECLDLQGIHRRAPSAFTSWIDTPAFGLTTGQKGATADPDNDGIENLLEYVLNGNPGSSDPAILPTLDTSGTNFVFSFTRRELSANDTTQVFEYGSDLGGWTPVNITPPTSAAVTLGSPVGGLQSVTITIPKTLAGPTGKLFGRLRVVQP